MLYLFVGPSSAGKSTAAGKVKDLLPADVVSGKDYLQKAKQEPEAWKLFMNDLRAAVNGASNMVYVLTDPEKFDTILQLGKVVVIRFVAELPVLKQRFSIRTRGVVPPPVEKMLAGQLDQWKSRHADHEIDTTHMTAEDAGREIRTLVESLRGDR